MTGGAAVESCAFWRRKTLRFPKENDDVAIRVGGSPAIRMIIRICILCESLTTPGSHTPVGRKGPADSNAPRIPPGLGTGKRLARFVCDIRPTPSFVASVKLGLLHASRVCLHFREVVSLRALGSARLWPAFGDF